MFKGFQSRLVLIVLLMFTAVYIVWPTYQKYFQLDYSNLSKDEKEKVDSKAIKLGLDLQGGMYVLLELDEKTLVEKLATTLPSELESIIDNASKNAVDLNIDFFNSFEKEINENEIRLSKYYIDLRKQSKLENPDNNAIIGILKNNRDQGIKSVIEILRNRIDEFGVSEPTIIRLGTNRIIVELAGVEDSNRARKLIQRTASLELSLVLDERFSSILSKLDEYFIKEKIDMKSANAIQQSVTASSNNVKDILLGETNFTDNNLGDLSSNLDIFRA